MFLYYYLLFSEEKNTYRTKHRKYTKMSLNTAHANGGVLIHAGESIILFCDNVEIEFSGQDSKEFKGIILTKKESEGTMGCKLH